MKTDKYYASNPKKNGKPTASTELKDEAPTSKVAFKLMYKNTKDKKYCD
jgi:hypothetical protein